LYDGLKWNASVHLFWLLQDQSKITEPRVTEFDAQDDLDAAFCGCDFGLKG